jgi:hypothetical protein
MIGKHEMCESVTVKYSLLKHQAKKKQQNWENPKSIPYPGKETYSGPLPQMFVSFVCCVLFERGVILCDMIIFVCCVLI